MNVYASVFRMRIGVGLQYRVAAAAGVVTQFFWGFMLIMVYTAFAAHNPGAAPMAPPQLAGYVWLQQAFLAFVALWFRDNELLQLIVSGNVAYELCRPQDLYAFWFARLTAQRLSAALLRCLPILLVAGFLPEPYRMPLPADPTAFALFLLTLCLGLCVTVAIGMFIYIGTFITMSPYATMLVLGTIGEFCSGGVIPLPMMPEPLRRFLLFLPFRLASDLPFRTYTGHLGTAEAAAGIALQFCWLAVLVLGGRLALSRALRRIVVQGG